MRGTNIGADNWYFMLDPTSRPKLLLQYQLNQEYIIEREGEYPTSLWACVTTLYGGHDLCNDIHGLEASVLAVCGHVAKPHVL